MPARKCNGFLQLVLGLTLTTALASAQAAQETTGALPDHDSNSRTAAAAPSEQARSADGAGATLSTSRSAKAGDADSDDADAVFATRLAELATAGYREKAAVVEALVAENHPHARAVLAALADGRLYQEPDGGALRIAGDGEPEPYRDAVTLSPVTGETVSEYKRLRTNIRLRRAVDKAIARIDLSDPRESVRAEAVDLLSETADDEVIALLRERRAGESSEQVLRRIDVAEALHALTYGDDRQRMDALQVLRGEHSLLVYNRVKALTAEASRAGPEVQAAAAAVIKRLDDWRAFYDGLETLFFGLSLGSVLVLAAIGLSITFGVMGVINMAHGELIMLGAYTAYVLQLLLPQHIGMSLALAIPAAFVVSGLAGVAIERGIVRHLYGRPLETLLATFGLSLLLQQLVRSVFSPLNRSVASPEFMQGLWQINGFFAITWNRLLIIGFMIAVFALLWMTLNRTSLGLKVRAVSQNRAMARAMGVRSARVDALTFGLGAGVAGVAGVALSQLTNVGPNLGQSYIVDSFMVVVFGGVGNLWGTLVGGLGLGVINKVLEPWAGAVMAKILVLVALILFIQRRPRGLFPQKGRGAEDA